MNRKLPLLIFAIIVGFSAWSQNNAPTWADDVACLVYSHCSNCHNSNGIAPFSLLSYNDAYTERFSIQYAVENKSMPPWQPNDGYSTLAHNKSLTPDEIQTIVDWVNAGAPEGNPADAPATPVYNSNQLIENPDLSVKIPNYTVPSITEDLYRCFVVPTGVNAEKFITAFEVVPGNRSAVHHVLFYVDTSGQGAVMDANDPGEGYTSFGGTGVNGTTLIGGWVPGGSATFYPDGMGPKLPANADIIVQIHYPYGSTGQLDSTKINFQLSDIPLREVRAVPFLNHMISITDGPLAIPADSIRTFHAEQALPINLTLLSIAPHAHLICEYMKAYITTPNNDTIPLIEIPHWDFHWQGGYFFPKPIKFPAGSKFHGVARYNNTNFNPNNPSFPPEDVVVGEATTDEMLIFYFSFLSYENGDENIEIDEPGSHQEHYENCGASVSSIENMNRELMSLTLMPNPAKDLVNISIEEGIIEGYELIDIQGKIIQSCQITSARSSVNIELNGITKGFYFVRVFSSSGYAMEKLVVE